MEKRRTAGKEQATETRHMEGITEEMETKDKAQNMKGNNNKKSTLEGKTHDMRNGETCKAG